MESLLHLSAFILFAHLSTIILLIAWKTDAEISDVEEIEWELFSAELIDNLAYSESLNIQIGNKGIRYKRNGDYYDVGYYNGMIRKQKNGTGHEPLLLSVQQVTFSADGNTLFLTVTFKSGKTRERSYVFPA